jgi:hypothetical protein
MSISQITSTGSTSASGSAAEIKVLERQLQSLQKQLTAEEKSKGDAQTKQLVEEQIQAQIEAVNAQIAQIQNESAKTSVKQSSSESSSTASKSATAAVQTKSTSASTIDEQV